MTNEERIAEAKRYLGIEDSKKRRRSKRRDRGQASQCVGKIQFATEADAGKSAKWIARYGDGKGRVSSYLCAHCGSWHNGRRAP